MAYKVLSPESEQLTFICGLGWPEVSRYYVSQRQQGLWEFWEQPPDSKEARMIFGWLAEGNRSETEVAKRLLVDYLGTFKAATFPTGENVQGLLSIKQIQRALRKHREQSQSSVLKFPIRPRPSGPSAA